MIPKIIHYCWFGDLPLPEEYVSYIAQWEELNPEWKLKCWNEQNSPISIPYINTAIKHQNWANISNYIRLHALLHEGGVYMDTDMKLIEPLNPLLDLNCFLGFESGELNSEEFWVNNAIMGSIPGHPFIISCAEYLLQYFDGTEKANLSSPHLTTHILKERFQLKSYGEQLLGDIKLYEKEVFYPVPFNKAYLRKEYAGVAGKTKAIHMWGRSWFTKEMMFNIIDELQNWDTIQQEETKSLHKKLLDATATKKESEGKIAEQERLLNELTAKLHEAGGQKELIDTLVNQYEKQIEEWKEIKNELSSKNELLGSLLVQAEKFEKEQKLIQSNLHESLYQAIQGIAGNISENNLLTEKIHQQSLTIEHYEQALKRNEVEKTQLKTIIEREAENNTREKELHKRYEQALAHQLQYQEGELSEKNNSIRQLNNTITLLSKLFLEKEQQLHGKCRLLADLEDLNTDLKKEITGHTENALKTQLSIEWYKRTFENRKVAGIIKDRITSKITNRNKK